MGQRPGPPARTLNRLPVRHTQNGLQQPVEFTLRSYSLEQAKFVSSQSERFPTIHF